jgi:general secretion pathway protein A
MSTTASSQNFYEMLDISPTANQSQINQAYYRLVKEFDAGDGKQSLENNQGDPIAMLQEAFDTLSDQKKRSDYDTAHNFGKKEVPAPESKKSRNNPFARTKDDKTLNVYQDYYGFTEKPFDLTPDPKYFYLSPKHKEVLAHLVYGLQENNGFLKIIGEVGTGKTTICRSFLRELKSNFNIAYIFNPCIDELELLQTINSELGLPAESNSKKFLIDTLNHFLLAERKKENRVVVIIDEAQDLQPSVLEQLRLLSNLETETEKLIQIVLIGQPELDDLLEKDGLRQLRQRITISWELLPLNFEETRGYIHHRLNVALGKGKVRIPRQGARWIYRYSHGIPRMINVITDRALLIAYTLNVKNITPKVVKLAVKDIGAIRPLASKGAFIWRTLIPVALGLATVFFAAKYFVLPDFTTSKANLGKDIQSMIAKNSAQLASAISINKNTATASTKTNPINPNTETPSSPEPVLAVSVPTANDFQEQVSPAPNSLYIAEENKLVTYLSSLTLDESKQEAMKWLLKAWNIDTEEIEDIQKVQDDYGMKVYESNATFERLIALNYPAMLEIALPNSQGTKYLSLTSLEGDSGSFGSIDRMKMPLELLDRLWTRKAIILWKDFENLPEDFESGFSGKESIWLQKNLRVLGYFKGSESLNLGPKTVSAIQAFQRNNKIPDDGKFNAESKLTLYSQLDIYSTPKLIIQ